MKYIFRISALNFLFAFLLFVTPSISFAQSDTISATDKSKIILHQPASTFNFYAISLYRYNLTNALRPDYAMKLFKGPIYGNNYFQGDYCYNFNSINPWGAYDLRSAIYCGTASYFLRLVDKKFIK